MWKVYQPGSGATSSGLDLSGVSKASARGSSNEGAIEAGLQIEIGEANASLMDWKTADPDESAKMGWDGIRSDCGEDDNRRPRDATGDFGLVIGDHDSDWRGWTLRGGWLVRSV